MIGLAATTIPPCITLLLLACNTVEVTAQGTSSIFTVPQYLGHSLYTTRFEGVIWDNDAWILETSNFSPEDYHAQVPIANGYTGLSMASNGPFAKTFPDVAGWPLFDQRQTFGTISGFYDRQAKTPQTNFDWLDQYGWDSVISGLPHWAPLIIELETGEYLDGNVDVDEISNFTSTFDFSRALARWTYTWTPSRSDGLILNITYTAFAHKLYVNQGYVQLELASNRPSTITVTNAIDGTSAVRTDAVEKGEDGCMIYTAVDPLGVVGSTAWIYAAVTTSSSMDIATLTLTGEKPYVGCNASSIAQSVQTNLTTGYKTTITKFVGIASGDAFKHPRFQARTAAMNAIAMGYDHALETHTREWASVLTRQSVSNFSNPTTGELPLDLVERQITSVVSVSRLIMETSSKNAIAEVNSAPINVWGVSVCGLTSDCYGGQKFWDQDVWMNPYLTAVFPFEAKQVINSRIHQYDQAKLNAQTAFTSSKNRTVFSDNAAVYPWTSGRDGNCTATGPCFDYEYHLNGDIVTSFLNYFKASGDIDFIKSSGTAATASIATFFSELVTLNGTKYVLTNMTDPDEYANFVDNGGFTMALISQTLQTANFFNSLADIPYNTTWGIQASNIYEPFDPEIDLTLEYSGMNNSSPVKQADVVLKIYPLDDTQGYNNAERLADLDYYAAKQSADGPGMTYAIFSIAAAEVSPSGCSSYTYDLDSWSPYVRNPWFQFSEQTTDDAALNGGTNPAYPFMTGHGGFLQVDLNGYLGLRYGESFNLRVNPDLPPQINNLRYPIFYYHGWPIEASANRTHTILHRLPTPLPTANTTFANTSISVQIGQNSTTLYPLHVNGTLTLSNRNIGLNATVRGNILQCGNIVPSNSTFVPGQFPIAAIDGANSTAWQPASSSAQSITVDLSSTTFQRVAYNYLNWAATPPVNFTIIYHNTTSATDADSTLTVPIVAITVPYDAQSFNTVHAYQSNWTVVTPETEIWTGKYATLIVQGNQANGSEGAPGATVAEWAVVGVTALNQSDE